MLVCARCDTPYPDTVLRWQCACGGHFRYRREAPARFDRGAIRERPATMWRYREALPPLAEHQVVSLGEGMTPLVAAPWGGSQVHFKLEYAGPTGSFKDRGAAVMISQFRAAGVTALSEDSSGNAGAAVAAYCARAGVRARVFVPAHASAGKAVQIKLFGADLVKVPGTREETTRAALAAAAAGGFYGSHNWSPYFIEGIRTVAFELWEQLGWRAPDAVVTPVGYGSLLLGLAQGFADLLAAGAIDRLPRLVAVQAVGCAALVQAWQRGAGRVDPVVPAPTIAEGIACAHPLRGDELLAALYQSDGLAVAVDDGEAWAALQALARQGLFVEPTAAVAPAAAARLIEAGVLTGTVVVPLSGSGLKATDKILALTGQG